MFLFKSEYLLSNCFLIIYSCYQASLTNLSGERKTLLDREATLPAHTDKKVNIADI